MELKLLLEDCFTFTMFQATLKLDRRLSSFQRKQIVSRTMKELDLEKCCLTRIAALSGGERKRVSMATEVLTV